VVKEFEVKDALIVFGLRLGFTILGFAVLLGILVIAVVLTPIVITVYVAITIIETMIKTILVVWGNRDV
jgi:hypothetical protein